MSVPEGERRTSRLEVHVKARELAVYTVLILKNAKTFAPEIDTELIQRIKSNALDIHALAWKANKIAAGTNAVNRETRYRMQEEAILLCDEMMANIGIAKTVFKLRHRRMKFWAGKITDVRKLLQAWKESDVSRYGQP